MNEGEIEQIRHNLIRLKVELQELSESFKETSQLVQLDQSSMHWKTFSNGCNANTANGTGSCQAA